MSREDFAAAYCQGFRLTVRFLISRGVPADMAEETAQAAWARGWERLHQLRDDKLLLTWANSIALNLYRTRTDMEKRIIPLFSGDTHVPAADTHVRVTDTNAMDVRKILSLCRLRDRHLLVSYYLDGRDTGEIAGREGLSETAIRIRLMRARRYAQKQALSLGPITASAA